MGPLWFCWDLGVSSPVPPTPPPTPVPSGGGGTSGALPYNKKRRPVWPTDDNEAEVRRRLADVERSWKRRREDEEIVIIES